jgi:hypothetical protein
LEKCSGTFLAVSTFECSPTVTAVETFASVMGVATADGNGDGGQNRVATKVLCNKEGGGDGGKSDGDKGGGRAMATVTMWVMGTAMRLAGDKEGECKGSTFDSDGNVDRWRWRQPPLKPFQRGSGRNNGYGSGRQQQKLRGQATINKWGRRQW